MQQNGRTYIAIDLKSFYASVECMERGLDPLTTNLVVADASRTEKTICLAVSPSLKAYGISGRARLFEVVERVKEVNAERRRKAGGELSEKSCDANKLAADPSREVDYLIAPPRMAKYIQISTQVYNVYLKYIAPEDIRSPTEKVYAGWSELFHRPCVLQLYPQVLCANRSEDGSAYASGSRSDADVRQLLYS